MFGRNKVAQIVAEFVGTGALTLVVLAIQRSSLSLSFFIAAGGGLAVAALIFVFGRSSGAQLNPAITFALWTARQVRTVEAIVYIVAQFLGGYLAYLLYTYLVNNHYQNIGGKYSTHIMIAEAVGTLVFSLGWATIVYQRLAGGVQAATAGITYMLGVIIAASASLGLINPALALGSNAWQWGNYLAGPVLGAVIGVNLYGLLFAPAENLVGTASFPRLAVAGRRNRTVAARTTTEVVEEKPVVAKKPVATTKAATAKTKTTKSTATKKKTNKRK